MSKTWQTVPIPPLMQELRQDPRGYPVPYVVLVDDTGTAHFKVNDQRRQLKCLQHGLCHICGHPITPDNVWMIGGPQSAFHPHGAYIDGPVHKLCGQYALQVCPYLGNARYNARPEDMENKPPIMTEDGTLVNKYEDPTVSPDRPGVFILSRTEKLYIDPNTMYLRPERPWKEVEYWQHGKQLSQQEFDAWLLTADLPGNLLFPDDGG